MRQYTVGIVGGGPGGLMTAYALQKISNSPMQITLFEASDRVGGKVKTPSFASVPIGYEAGAAEFYDYSAFRDDPLKELVLEMGLPISRMGGPAVIYQNRVIANTDDLARYFGPQTRDALMQFDRFARDRMTPREFYHSDHPEGIAPSTPKTSFIDSLQTMNDRKAREYLEVLIHSDLATEPSRTSEAYGLQNYLMNDSAYMEIYGIEGGNERLTRALADRLFADIRLKEPVKNVRKVGASLQIVSQPPEGERQQLFDFVVVALPLNQLDSIAFDDPPLADAMRAHAKQYDFPAHYLRITLLFQKPFWKQTVSDSYWMLDHFGGCCLYDESSRIPGCEYGILGWLLAGEAAEKYALLSDAELVEQALQSLPSYWEDGRDDLIESRVHRWINAVNALPGGWHPHPIDQRHQPARLSHPELFVVGDYLYDSTLNGVKDSADYVAAWIASQMTRLDSLA